MWGPNRPLREPNPEKRAPTAHGAWTGGSPQIGRFTAQTIQNLESHPCYRFLFLYCRARTVSWPCFLSTISCCVAFCPCRRLIAICVRRARKPLRRLILKPLSREQRRLSQAFVLCMNRKRCAVDRQTDMARSSGFLRSLREHTARCHRERPKAIHVLLDLVGLLLLIFRRYCSARRSYLRVEGLCRIRLL